MITVIIPTMCIPDRIYLDYTIDQCEKSDCVSKIIIIDNTEDGKFSRIFEHTNKMMVISNHKNIGVNPAWNTGMKHCDTDYWCLLNDDVLCHRNIFSKVIECYNKNDKYNILTIPSVNTKQIHENTIKEYDSVMETNQYEEKFGDSEIPLSGCIMFGKKQAWEDIPEKLIVFFGDSFLYYRSEKKGFVNTIIKSLHIIHGESVTSHKFNNRFIDEKLIWDNEIYPKIYN